MPAIEPDIGCLYAIVRVPAHSQTPRVRMRCYSFRSRGLYRIANRVISIRVDPESLWPEAMRRQALNS